jgi:DNA polymerase-3 subunit chi
LSDAIWTWRDEAFIPHGTAEDGHAEMQPILIVDGETAETPNGADVLFLVEGAAPREEDFAQFARICVLFPDADAACKDEARALWKRLKDREGLALTYWQQDARGRWERKA